MTTVADAPVLLQPAAAQADALAVRHEVLTALDGVVRPLLRRRLLSSPAMMSFLPPVVDLTVYDAVYRATPAAGGHWTVAVRRPLIFAHQLASFTVTLAFDGEQRPAHYRVHGASEVVSDDATVEALDRALTRAATVGPQITWAPSFVPGISL